MRNLVAYLCLAALFSASQTFGAEMTLDFRPKKQTQRRVCNVRAKDASTEVDGVLRETRLSAADAPVVCGNLAVKDKLVFRLFDDKELALDLVEKTPSPLGGISFLADASGVDGVRNAVVVQTADGLQADVQDYRSGVVYTISSTADGVTVREILPTKQPCSCGKPLAPPVTARRAVSGGAAGSAAVRQTEKSAADGGAGSVYVDVLVAYDTQAASYVAASGGNITNFAEVAVQKMNTAIANTGLDSCYRYRLVGVFAAEGDAGGALSYVLDSIVGEGTTLNGYNWSVLNDVRESVCADVVTVLIDNGTAWGNTGIGFSLESYNADYFDAAFNACLVRAVEEGHTMTHEVGHNMGAGHSDAMADVDNRGPQFYEYSSGFYFTVDGRRYHTIMAYDEDGYGNYYTLVPYFSSPDYTYGGVAVGDASHDNTRTLRNNFKLVSDFRKPSFVSSDVGVGLDAEAYEWETSGTYPWSIDYAAPYDGVDCARSCEMSGDTTSWTKTYVQGPATMSFTYKLRTYGGTFTVSCDGDAVFEVPEAISYGYSWSSESVEIPDGIHEVKLSYTHPSRGFTEGGNGVWIDRLAFEGGSPAPTAEYTVVFHRNDASDELTAVQDLPFGVEARLPSLAGDLGWARRGYTFLGWGRSANAADVWIGDCAEVKDLASSGATVDLYAVWAIAPSAYAIHYIRNDGAGTWRKVGFKHGVKTRMPSLANGLKWARRGYTFKGWELTTANANDNTRAAPWKGDWAYVSTPVDAGKTLMAYARWELTPGYYQIRFNRNDGSGKWRSLGFQRGKSTKLSTIGALGWERDGYEFVGWASNKANADAGKLWKRDGEWIKDVIAEGKTLSIYAVWKKK